jgi:hypothetical protein
MAVSAKLFGLFAKSAVEGKLNLASDTVKVMLCSSAYTPNQDTHQFKSDVTGEVSGTNYTAGGVAVANLTRTYDASTNQLKIDCDDPSFSNVTLTGAGTNAPRYAVFYDSTPGTDATRPLIAYVDFGQDEPRTAGTLTIQLDPLGFAVLTAA